jgi:drug/metabolite transporter (DMT)-like permease
LRLIRSSICGTRLSGNWVDYTAWLIVVDNVTFLLVARLVRGRALWATLSAMKGRVIVRPAGIDLVWRVHVGVEPQSVGAVSALRETSVFFAILIGILPHREPLSARRIGAGLLIVAGIFTIAVSK